MRWCCFLLVSVALPAGAAAQTAPAGTPRFDLTVIPATRDSFVYFLHGEARGYAVWQYEIRSPATGQQLLYTARSEFTPVEEEQQRVVLNRVTGQPLSSFHHIDLFNPESDTVMVEHDLEVKGGAVTGRRRIGTRDGDVGTLPVSQTLPPGAVWSSYVLYAAAATNLAPGESLEVQAYREFTDSLVTLTLVAGRPTSVAVPAGRFDVLPITSGDFVLYVTRTPPRRVVKGETSDRVFSFQLAGSGRPIPVP